MSDPLETRPEILKLARLLGSSPERLAYLEKVPPQDIGKLREQVTDVLFTANEATFKRLAAASRLLPLSLVVMIGQRAFGPVLAARITGLLEPGRAVELAETMPTAFLADVAIELDPRRAQAVIAGMPPARTAEVTRELAQRGEFVTLGRFVGQLRPEALTAAVGVLSNGDLLRAAYVMDEKKRVADLVGLLSEDRLDGLVEAARDEDLCDEIIDLVRHLKPKQRAALARRARETGFLDALGPLGEALSA